MLILAGIDEAGYGPMFGPLVITRCVLTLSDLSPGDLGPGGPPDLWELLKPALSRDLKDPKHRIAINDSKKLLTPAAGLSHLERGVLAFLGLANPQPPDLEGLLQLVALDDESRACPLPWYSPAECAAPGGPPLPHALTEGQLAISSSLLARAAGAAGLAGAEFSAAILFEDRFNRLTEATRSKGRTAWTFVARHLNHLWMQQGPRHPWVVIDRQGGRKNYIEQCRMIAPEARVTILREDDEISRYALVEGGRSMMLSFEIQSEERHMPVALASMLAKYVRELLMTRFNHFWQRHLPDLKSTKGYVQDGRRFLEDIQPMMGKLGIAPQQIIRCR